MATTPEKDFEDTPASRLQAEPTRPPSAGYVLTNAREACNRSMALFQHCRKAYTQFQYPKQSLLKIQYGDAYDAYELPYSPRGPSNHSWQADSVLLGRPCLRGDIDASHASLGFATGPAPSEPGDSQCTGDSSLAGTDGDDDDVSAPIDSRLGPYARRALLAHRRHKSPANQADVHAIAAGAATASAYPSSAPDDLSTTSEDDDDKCSPRRSWTPHPTAHAAALSSPTQLAEQARASKATFGPSGLSRAWTHHRDSPTPACEMVQDGSPALTVRRSHTAAPSFLSGGLVARPHPPTDSDRRRPQRPYRRATADGPTGSAYDLRPSTSESSGGGGRGSRRYGGGAASIRGRTATDTAGNTNTDMEDSDGPCTREWLSRLPQSLTTAVGPAGGGRNGPPLRPSCHPASRCTKAVTANMPFSARRCSAPPGLPGASQHLDEHQAPPSASSLPADPALDYGSGRSRSASPPSTSEGKRRRSKLQTSMTRSTAISYLLLSADRPPWSVSKPDKPPSRQRRQDAAELRSLSLRRLPIRSTSPAFQPSPSGVGGVSGGGGGANSCTTSRPHTAECSWHSFTCTAAVVGSLGGAAAASLTSRVNRSAGSGRSLSAMAHRRASNTVVPHTPVVPRNLIDAAPLHGKGRFPALDTASWTLGTAGQMRSSRRSLDETNLYANRSHRLGQATTTYVPCKDGGRSGDGDAARGGSDNGERQPTRGARTVGAPAINSGGGAAAVHTRFSTALHASTGAAAGDVKDGNGKVTLMTRLFKALNDLRRTDAR